MWMRIVLCVSVLAVVGCDGEDAPPPSTTGAATGCSTVQVDPKTGHLVERCGKE